MKFPQRFIDLHREEMLRCWQKYGPVFRIIPREPLGAPLPLDGAMPDTVVTIVQVQGINRDGVVYFTPLTPADRKAAEEWDERHRHTTLEQFLWHPFEGKSNVEA